MTFRVLITLCLLGACAASAPAFAARQFSSPPARQQKSAAPNAQTQQAAQNSGGAASPGAAQPDLAQKTKAALDRNDFAAAIPLLQQMIAAQPAEAGLHFELGYAYSALKRYDEAAGEYRRATELDPKLAAAHQNLGLVLLDTDSDPAAALAEFRAAAALEPDKPQPRFLAGQALERANKPDEAIAEYQAAMGLAADSDPRKQAMLFALGRALLEAGRAADAETQFRALLKLEDAAPGANAPANGAAAAGGAERPPAALGLAEALVQEGKKEEAAGAFAKYLAGAPEDRSAHYDLAALLHGLGRLDDALAELDRADALPAAPAGLSGTFSPAEELKLRGNIYIEQMKWMQARDTLAKAAAAAPGDADLHAWLGRAEMELHDFPSAEAELQRAVMLDARQLDAERDLIAVYSSAGQFAEALAASDQLAQRTALEAGDWFFRAVACDRLGRKAEAAEAYQKFLDLDQGKHTDQDFQAQGRLVVLRKELKK